MRFLEFVLIGFVVTFMFGAGFSFGRFYEREIAPRAESVSRIVPDRELNMPLLPKVPNKGTPGQRTRF